MFFSALAPAASTLAAVASGTRRNSSSSRRHAPDDARVLAAIPARGTSVAARRARSSVSGVYVRRVTPLFTARSGDLSRRGHRFAVRTRAASDSGASSPREDADSPGFVGAPMSPGSPSGQILAHVLDNESHLFTAAVEATLDRMADELDQEETRANSVDVSEDESDRQGLVLFRRIQQMRALERRNGVQDVMYANILQKFRNIGVDMLPPMDEESVYLKGVDLNQLTNGVHSVEALEMVKEHLMGMLGPQASNAYSNSLVRMSKLQAAQMYAASIMFGYFLRRADKRFSLDRAAGTLPMNPSESAAALEALFNSASAMDSMDEADAGANARGFAAEEFAFDADGTGSGSGSGSGSGLRVGRGREHHPQAVHPVLRSADVGGDCADRLPGGRGARGAPDRRALRLGGGTRAGDAIRARGRGGANHHPGPTHGAGARRRGGGEGEDGDPSRGDAEARGARGGSVRKLPRGRGELRRRIRREIAHAGARGGASGDDRRGRRRRGGKEEGNRRERVSTRRTGKRRGRRRRREGDALASA